MEKLSGKMTRRGAAMLAGRPYELLREYFVRFVTEESVSNEGTPCSYCALIGAFVECNVHAVDMDGHPLYAECCTSCVLAVLDGELDVDPSHTVTVERKNQP